MRHQTTVVNLYVLSATVVMIKEMGTATMTTMPLMTRGRQPVLRDTYSQRVDLARLASERQA